MAKYDYILTKIENYDGDQSGKLIKRLGIRNPVKVLPLVPFNLMIKSTVGPSSAAHVYLRPETAQGQLSIPELQEAHWLQPGLDALRLRER